MKKFLNCIFNYLYNKKKNSKNIFITTKQTNPKIIPIKNSKKKKNPKKIIKGIYKINFTFLFIFII